MVIVADGQTNRDRWTDAKTERRLYTTTVQRLQGIDGQTERTEQM